MTDHPVLLALRPGDRVLVALVEDPSPEDSVQWAGQLGASFPGVQFTVVGGVAGLLVQAPTAKELR